MAASSLASLVVAAALALAPPPARAGTAKKAASKNPTVTMYHVNSKETMRLRLRDADGKPVKGLQKRFDRFLRCHHTNAKHAMNPRLMRVMYQAGKHWPAHRLEVVAGYRHPDVAKNPHSPHMKGVACDFRVAGVKNAELRDYLRKSFKKVGVGYYPNSSFVHLDVRKDRSAFWVDYSGPGDRAMYSETPDADVKTGRADSYRPTTIGNDWVDGDDNSSPNGGEPPATANNAPSAGVQGPASSDPGSPRSAAAP